MQPSCDRITATGGPFRGKQMHSIIYLVGLVVVVLAVLNFVA